MIEPMSVATQPGQQQFIALEPLLDSRASVAVRALMQALLNE